MKNEGQAVRQAKLANRSSIKTEDRHPTNNRIHRDLYYAWIEQAIRGMNTDIEIRSFLNTVRVQLLHGNIKQEMKLQSEIDEAEFKHWLKKNKQL